jgi:predicted GNAT family acetyltransferase
MAVRRSRCGVANDRDETMNGSVDKVINNTERKRYELSVDGHIAAAYYEKADGVITFVHTEVPSELGGRGIGSKLVRGALDLVRADGLKVVAECPFVKGFIEKHADYQDLLKR